MTFRIWTDKSHEEADEGQCYLKLAYMENNDHNAIMVMAVDKLGNDLEDGAILGISNNLKAIIINSDINESLPIKTDIEDHAIAIRQSELEEITLRKGDVQKDMFLDKLVQAAKDKILNDSDAKTNH